MISLPPGLPLSGLIVLAACVATLLPVPIAFDVIVVSALLSAGADPGLATAVLFALGIYSIYPALVIAKEISVRLSGALACTVAAVALLLAFATQGFNAAGIETERRIIARGLTEAAYEAYDEAMNVCEALPESLHSRCFTAQIDKFSPYIEEGDLCDYRPGGIDAQACADNVAAALALQTAIDGRDRSKCSVIEAPSSRSNCEFSVVLRLAIAAHDVEQCNALGTPENVAECRTQYVSSSLLFNPDDSICRNLAGGELADCQMNARVYRLAETMDFAGCADFRRANQREFCTYVIASSMIGRQNDSSGCAQLTSPELIERCRSQVFAWQAERQKESDHCALIVDTSIRTMCQLRVAGLQIDAILAGATVSSRANEPLVPEPQTVIDATRPASAPAFAWTTVSVTANIELRSAQLLRSAPSGDRQFRAIQARDLGISDPWEFRATDFFEPFIVGKGIASGDFNNDSWPDLVFASDAGVVVYQNTGGEFAAARVTQGALADENTFVVAFVDANNDEYPDIFASSYGGANYLLLNSDGSFETAELVELPGDRQLTFAAGFADLNGDGKPDIVHGNWTSGVERLFSPDQSGNEILFSHDDEYRVVVPDEIVGETLSVLLTDIDVDGDTDLLIANDRIVPDMHYLNDGNGELRRIEAQTGLFPLTSMFTMSLESADFNNDLIPDLFSTDMTFARSSRSSYCNALPGELEKARCETYLNAYDGFQSGSALVCSEIESRTERQDCFVAFALQAAKNLKDPAYCEQLPAVSRAVASLCHLLASAVPPEDGIDQSAYVRQVQRNTLLIGTAEGFVEQAERFGVDSSFWSWNGKAADLDNDGWQDIYVGNGFHFGDNFYEIQENLLYRNIGGEQFEERASDWGLNDPINTPSYTYVDFDRDGDLDIVATGVLAPPRIYVNDENVGNSLLIQLLDQRGNSSAIGAVVTIGYGESEQLRQRREIRLSGGFLSFDEPIAHFGLGPHTHIDWIEVQWPDGELSRIDSSIAAATMLQIRRH